MRAVITAALVAAGLVAVPGAQAERERGRGGERENPVVLGLSGWDHLPSAPGSTTASGAATRDVRTGASRPTSSAAVGSTAGLASEARGTRAVTAGEQAPVSDASLPLSPSPALPLSPSGVLALRPATSGAAPGTVAPLMTIAQLQYEGGGDWYANPTGLPNLLNAIRTRTGLPVADRPAHVKITDPDLWQYPYLYMTGHGNVHFSDEEVQLLRSYLSAGGFLHADDNYGMDVSFRREIRRIFPDAKLVELPKDHPVYHLFYDFPRGLPKIHKHDGTPAQGFGLFHDGRLVVFYSYESDLGNGWEDPQTYGDPPALHEAALRMGVNLFMYATSQVAR